jgi:acyl carrier protein
MDKVFNKVIGLVSIYSKVDQIEINGESRLREHLGIKSADIVNLIVNIEDEFNVEVDISKINTASFSTVNSVCDLVISIKGGL